MHNHETKVNSSPKTHTALTRSNQWLRNRVDDFRHRLAHSDALPQLTLLGLLVGIAAALIIVAFRFLIEYPISPILGDSENFESLPPYARLLLATGGGLIIGLLLHWVPAAMRQISVGHVIERLHNHQSKLPAGNFFVQFVGGVLCLLTGQSVGREGPAVHLGAATASQLGQWLKLPHNSLRTLAGCGVAAAISASFNTPMAGVIFAMEVVLMEYTIIGFLPVILASVSGAIVTQIIFGPEPAFSIAPIQMNSLWELPYMAGSGLVIAMFAATYIRLQLSFNQRKHWPVIVRCTLAGLLTGVVALFLPQVMGIGYDTVELAMGGEIAIGLLIAIALAKTLVTTASTGLGLPGGLIGPIFMIGACLGGAIGITGQALFPESTATPSFYVMLGMGALVASALNAPLAALMAVVELTYNPNIIFPTMLVIVVACVTVRHAFHCEGIFMALLSANNTPIQQAPLRQALSREAVRSLMDTAFIITPYQIGYQALRQKLKDHPQWVIADELGDAKYLLPAADVAHYLESAPDEILVEDELIDLREIPGRRSQLRPINQQASLLEAQRRLQQEDVDALFVERLSTPLQSPVMGIITPDMLENYYRV